LLTIKEFAEFMKVNPATIYKWIRNGMPVIKLEDTIRIDQSEAINWLKENRN